MTTQSEHASLDHTNPSKLPILTEGILTPRIASRFELGCLDYFGIKDTATEKQVPLAMASIRDGHIRDWINSDRDHLKTLSFSDFIDEIRERYLDADREDKIRREILCCELKPPYHFWNWATEITNKNRLLTANKQFDDPSLIDILESRLPADIESRLRISRRSGLEISKKLTPAWMNDVKDIVNVYQNDIKRAREVADGAASRSTKRPRPLATSMNTVSSSSAPSSTRTDRLRLLSARSSPKMKAV